MLVLHQRPCGSVQGGNNQASRAVNKPSKLNDLVPPALAHAAQSIFPFSPSSLPATESLCETAILPQATGPLLPLKAIQGCCLNAQNAEILETPLLELSEEFFWSTINGIPVLDTFCYKSFYDFTWASFCNSVSSNKFYKTLSYLFISLLWLTLVLLQTASPFPTTMLKPGRETV